MDCWHQQIERAATEEEVVRSTRDYLFLWAPQELAPLTQGWRSLSIESAADVERVKRWLTEGLFGTHSIAPSATQLRELANYFWHATARIGEIRRVTACAIQWRAMAAARAASPRGGSSVPAR